MSKFKKLSGNLKKLAGKYQNYSRLASNDDHNMKCYLSGISNGFLEASLLIDRMLKKEVKENKKAQPN